MADRRLSADLTATPAAPCAAAAKRLIGKAFPAMEWILLARHVIFVFEPGSPMPLSSVFRTSGAALRALSTTLRGQAAALLGTVALLGGLSGTAQAEPVWQQSSSLSGALLGMPEIAVTGTTAVVTFTDQTVSNDGLTAEQFGMYIAWAWIYDGDGQDTPLIWSNADQLFRGDGVTLTVRRIGFAEQTLLIGDILGDTWAGTPRSPGFGTPITASADWDVPFLDFGVLAAGAELSYGLELTFNFESQAALSSFSGNLNIGTQGVQAAAVNGVPEPGALALLGAALLAATVARRARRQS